MSTTAVSGKRIGADDLALLRLPEGRDPHLQMTVLGTWQGAGIDVGTPRAQAQFSGHHVLRSVLNRRVACVESVLAPAADQVRRCSPSSRASDESG